MGGNQSRQRQQQHNGSSTTKAQNGNGHHKQINRYDSDDDDDYTDNQCHFFLSMFCPPKSSSDNGSNIDSVDDIKGRNRQQNTKNKKKNNTDFLGTPIPDTPIEYRRKRQQEFIEQQQEQQQHQQQILFSSRYSGLEKEASERVYTTAGQQQHFLINPNNRMVAPLKTTSNGGYGVGGMADSTSNSSLKDLLTEYEKQPSAQIHMISDDDNDGGRDTKTLEDEFYEKYELCEVLGVGSTSTCHRCVNKQTKEQYACKIIDKAHIEERFQGMIDQFHREIQTLRSLKHPNIIRLYDVYIDSSKIYFVMELMEGGELFDYVVEKGTLTEEEASRIIKKVTSALVYMHSKNIIHRDLKPENLLIKRKPKSVREANTLEIKIIDFGLSKVLHNEPVARSFLGTRGYLAPEMLQRRDYSRAVDSWALGVITFVLVCGCLPFDDDTATVPSDELVEAKFVLRFPRWASNLSSSVKDLLSHLLDINPIKRYTAEQALKHPWVRGKTASPKTLLASPKQMRVKGATITNSPKNNAPYTYNVAPPSSAGIPGVGGAHLIPPPPPPKQANYMISPGGTRRTLVRKTSI